MTRQTRGRPRTSTKHPDHILLEKIPPYVWYNSSGLGKWMLKYYDNDLLKWRSKRLCSSKASLAQIWDAFESAKKKNTVTFQSLSLEFQKSNDWVAYMKNTQRDYLGCHRAICTRKTSTGQLLGDLPISIWTTPFTRKYLDTRLKESVTRANRELSYLKAVCKWAIEYGKIKENFAKDLRKKKETPLQHTPGDKEYNFLLQIAQESAYSYMCPAMES